MADQDNELSDVPKPPGGAINDQFELNEDGELIVNDGGLSDIISALPRSAGGGADEAGSISVSVTGGG